MHQYCLCLVSRNYILSSLLTYASINQKHFLPTIILCSSIIFDYHFSIFEVLQCSLFTFTIQKMSYKQSSPQRGSYSTPIVVPLKTMYIIKHTLLYVYIKKNWTSIRAPDLEPLFGCPGKPHF